jgi:hypothetical protein
MPRMAAMAPAPTGTASCMACARKRTRGAACASVNTPDATSAEYSPSEWPGHHGGQIPALGQPGAVGCDTGHQHHRLGVGGQRQRFLRAFLDQAGHVLAQRVTGFASRFRPRPDGRPKRPACQRPASPGREIQKQMVSWSEMNRLTVPHVRRTAPPQVNPPPTPSSMRVSPFLTWPLRTAESSASGIEAAEVLPCWSTVTTTLSMGSFSVWPCFA